MMVATKKPKPSTPAPAPDPADIPPPPPAGYTQGTGVSVDDGTGGTTPLTASGEDYIPSLAGINIGGSGHPDTMDPDD
jgi:hypothetical protein